MKIKKINKKIFILIFTFVGICNLGCSQKSIDEKRKEVMFQITNLIIKCEYQKIYNFIDTSFGKDNLDFDISFLSKKLSKKESEISKDDFNLFDDNGLKDDSNYKLRVYLKGDRFDYIDLVFNFNPKIYNRIYSLNKYAHEKTEKQLKLPPH